MLALVAVLVVAGGAGLVTADQEEPVTEETIGYVDGVWYDDELSVDDQDDAVVAEEDLDEVVARSMARVEVIREKPFLDDVDVDVVTRSELEADMDELMVDLEDDQVTQQNVLYEALFMIDQDTDAVETIETLYQGAIGGFYDPAAEEIVLVSDSPDEPEVDEVTLGHEVLHAQQDQYFDLESLERTTSDQSTAVDGLVEGEAVMVDTEYQMRCQTEWDCLPEPSLPEDAGDLSIHEGVFLQFFHPYSDGPDYVEAIYEAEGWSGVDEHYEDPPSTAASIIHQETDRPVTDVEFEDRSSEEWEPLPREGGQESNTIGEVGLATMFMYATWEAGEPVGLETESFQAGPGSYDYAHDVTDGWAGDAFVAYESDGGETGYAWEIALRDEEEAETFLEGYSELLAAHDATSLEDYADVYEVGDGFPEVVAVDLDGESVRIVAAPSLEQLDEVDADLPIEGDDRLSVDDTDEADDDSLLDPIPAPGVPVALAALGLGVVVLLRRR